MIAHPIVPDRSLYYTVPPTQNVNTTPDRSTPIDAIEDTLDLSAEGRSLARTFAALDPAERGEYLEILARLLKSGIVGTETLEVNGRPYTSFASTRFADPRLARAPIARPRTPGGNAP